MSEEDQPKYPFLTTSIARLSFVHGRIMEGLESLQLSELQKQRGLLVTKATALIHQGTPVTVEGETQNPADGKIYPMDYPSTQVIPVRLRPEDEPVLLSAREGHQWEGDATVPDGFSLFVHTSPDIQKDRGSLLCSVRNKETCGLDNSRLIFIEEAVALQEVDRVLGSMENFLKAKETGLTRGLQEIFGRHRAVAMDEQPELILRHKRERLSLMYKAEAVYKDSTEVQLVDNPGPGVHFDKVFGKVSPPIYLHPFEDCDLEARLVEHSPRNPGFDVVINPRGNNGDEIILFSVNERTVSEFDIDTGKGTKVLSGEDEFYAIKELEEMLLKFLQASQIAPK